MDFRPQVRACLPPPVSERDSDIVEELAQHLGDIYQESLDEGLDHQAAWTRAVAVLQPSADARAARDFADTLRSASRTPAERVADRWRAALDEPIAARRGRWPMLTDLRRDLRYAIRTLGREPGFTAVIVLTLALGIGATAAIVSAVDAVLWQGPPVFAPHRLVSVFTVWNATAATRGRDGLGASSYPDYVDLRERGALADAAAYAAIDLTLDAEGVTDRVSAEIVTANYFDVLGVPISPGRGFTADEDRVGAPVRAVVLGHALWRQRFGADAGIVGRTLTVNGQPFTVIGVAPASFSGLDSTDAADLWVPMGLQDIVRPPSASLRRRLGGTRLLEARDARWLNVVGRLRAGASLAETAAMIDTASRALAAVHPASNRELRAATMPLGEGPGLRQSSRPVLALLGAASGLVLVIACANVAGLLLTRAITRRREVAVRMAIGAGQAQLVRQWLTEAIVLGLLGAAAALVVAALGAPILHGLGIPDRVDLGVNLRVLGLTLATGVVTGLIFGLAPVVQSVRRETLASLRDEGGGVATGARAARVRSGFVVLQIALSLVLLVGAGLFLRSVVHVYGVDLGYRPERVLVAEIDLGSRYSPEAGQVFHRELLGRLNALPGVAAAGAARVAVLSGTARTVPVSVDGQPLRPDFGNAIPVRSNVVSEGYLDAMGIDVAQGRGFVASDTAGAPRVAIVSRALAARLWPNADPIGRRLVSTESVEVVGVAPDTVYLSATERDPRPFFYVPLAQQYESGLALHVRATGDPLALVPAVRDATRRLDPQIAVARPRRLIDDFDRSLQAERTLATFVSVLSGMALLLAGVGIYGVMAHATRQRTPEIGLRLALGATPGSILGLMLTQGARLVAIGCGLGLTGAFFGARLIRARLFGIEPGDAVTWLGVSLVLLLVTLAACAIPARRAMRTDPASTLRGS